MYVVIHTHVVTATWQAVCTLLMQYAPTYYVVYRIYLLLHHARDSAHVCRSECAWV